MVRGSHSTRSVEFRLAQGTVTLFSNFTPQRGKGTKHNPVSLSLLCILNLIDETRLNLNCLFFLQFGMFLLFAFSGIGGGGVFCACVCVGFCLIGFLCARLYCVLWFFCVVVKL